jgi:hypothetical protein
MSVGGVRGGETANRSPQSPPTGAPIATPNREPAVRDLVASNNEKVRTDMAGPATGATSYYPTLKVADFTSLLFGGAPETFWVPPQNPDWEKNICAGTHNFVQ